MIENIKKELLNEVIDKRTYDMVQDIISDAVWKVQKKIEEELGIVTDVDINWKITKESKILCIKGPFTPEMKLESHKEYIVLEARRKERIKEKAALKNNF